MKQRLVKYLVSLIKWIGAEKIFLNTPLTFISTNDWIKRNETNISCRFIPLEPPRHITEAHPLVIGHPVSRRFSKHYERNTNEAFVAIIPKGRVFGEFSNFIITPDNQILSDVSREFGSEGGVMSENYSIFHSRMHMPVMGRLTGKIAVISTCGSNNFHHWNFDILPRLHLLSKAGFLNEIDKFIIHHDGLKFQLEGLVKYNIGSDKIINPKGNPQFFFEAELLFIPSLPEDLGTISPWVIDFLRKIYLKNTKDLKQERKLFLSRKNAPTRKIVNNKDVQDEILSRGFIEFTPEDFSIEEVAGYFSSAKSIISVHGSGLSNLPFVEEGTKVLDIMAPFHQDPYYWMICNQRKAKYVALFSEGDHPADDLDLVKNKVDSDLLIDLEKLKTALDQVL